MFAIIGKLVVALVLIGGTIIGGHVVNGRIAERRAQRNYEQERKIACLHEYDGPDSMGGIVARLPLPLTDGTIPEVIRWNGKTYRHDPWSGVGRDWVEVPDAKKGAGIAMRSDVTNVRQLFQHAVEINWPNGTTTR